MELLVFLSKCKYPRVVLIKKYNIAYQSNVKHKNVTEPRMSGRRWYFPLRILNATQSLPNSKNTSLTSCRNKTRTPILWYLKLRKKKQFVSSYIALKGWHSRHFCIVTTGGRETQCSLRLVKGDTSSTLHQKLNKVVVNVQNVQLKGIKNAVLPRVRCTQS